MPYCFYISCEHNGFLYADIFKLAYCLFRICLYLVRYDYISRILLINSNIHYCTCIINRFICNRFAFHQLFISCKYFLALYHGFYAMP